MCRLLIDANVWNYFAKARALGGFLASLEEAPVILPDVVEQLRLALGKWPGLNEVVLAVERGAIQASQPTDKETEEAYRILAAKPGFGLVDCTLLAVCKLRRWRLLTCDTEMLKTAAKAGIDVVGLAPLLDYAVERGFLSTEDHQWVTAYWHGHTGHRGK